MIHISVKNSGCLFFFGLVFLWRRSAMHILFLNKAQYFISPFFRFIISQCPKIKQKQKKILTFDLKFKSPHYTQIYETSPGSSKSDGLSILTLYEVFKFRCTRCTRYTRCPQTTEQANGSLMSNYSTQSTLSGLRQMGPRDMSMLWPIRRTMLGPCLGHIRALFWPFLQYLCF